MTGLYIRLAAVGVRKNGKSYIPYILTAAVMVSVFYIVAFLSNNTFLAKIYGGNMMSQILTIGIIIMALFSAIFLFYTNSSLIKRRKKEFGLYNILGLKKSQIAHVLVWETLIVYALSVIGGLGLGILFSKLAEHLAARMLQGDISYTFSVDRIAVIMTLIVFAAIFLVIMLNSLRQLFFSRPIELLRSGNTGEKPPRANVPIAVLGALMLGTAYYIAVTIKNQNMALNGFTLAVLLVIPATYLLFIAGSTALCSILKKNKKYYYDQKHFVSISQMMFRMRKNGAGLASICILSTMMLVTVSSTAAMYFGVQSYVDMTHPSDIEIVSTPNSTKEDSDLEELIRNVYAAHSIEPSSFSDVYEANFRGELNEALVMDKDKGEFISSRFYTAEGFPEEPVSALKLADNELAYCEPYSDFMKDRQTLTICGIEFTLKRIDAELDAAKSSARYSQSMTTPDPLILAFVNRETLFKMSENTNSDTPFRTMGFKFSENVTDDEIESLDADIEKKFSEYREAEMEAGGEFFFFGVTTKKETLGNWYGVYGGLFFLGILLGGVFLLAAVLVMYYKQISEGFEDAERFRILRKVGMSRRSIKSAINSQVLITFFMPLIAAGMHMAFAFPLLKKVINLMESASSDNFLPVAVVCYLIYAAVYILVYKATSSSYSRIVNK